MLVDRPMAEGTVISLTLPAKRDSGVRGKTVLGHVVHAGQEAGRNVIGVQFGWEAATPKETAPQQTGLWSRLLALVSGHRN